MKQSFVAKKVFDCLADLDVGCMFGVGRQSKIRCGSDSYCSNCSFLISLCLGLAAMSEDPESKPSKGDDLSEYRV